MDDKKKDTDVDKKNAKAHKEFNPKTFINTEPRLNEAAKKDLVVISFGRMNPITVGHEKLVSKVIDVATKGKGVPQIYLSHSNDPKKNPLTYDQKIKYGQKAFGSIITKSKAKTVIQVAVDLQSKYKNLIMVAGSDRVKEFETLLKKYNGKDYTFDSVEVVSAGERDPDAEGVSGMSASKMRSAAADNEFDQFKSGLPKKLQSSGKEIFDIIRKTMNLDEGCLYEALTNQQRKDRARQMKRLAPKIAKAKAKALKKKASPDKLKARAQKSAIGAMKDKLAKGKGYSELPFSQRQKIDDKVKKMSKGGKISQLAKKLLPSIKDKEKTRFSNLKKEDLNIAFENFIVDRGLEEVCRPDRIMKRPHMMLTKDNAVKYDKRFKMYKSKNKEIADVIDKELEVCESTGDSIINFKDIAELMEAVEELTEVAKIACLKCDEVSTAKAWAKNDDVCPKCNKSTQGVAESLEEAKAPTDKDIDAIIRTMDDLENGVQLLDAKYGLDRKKAQALIIKRQLSAKKNEAKDEKTEEEPIPNDPEEMDDEQLMSADTGPEHGSEAYSIEKQNAIRVEVKRRGLDEACGNSHEVVGKKLKGGKLVPNIVAKEAVNEAINKESPLYKEYEGLKGKSVKDLKRIYQQNHRIDTSGFDFGGKANIIADILRDRHGAKRLKVLYNESLDEAKAPKMYNVVKNGKPVNKEPMTTQRALDHYDSLGGNAKGYAVKPVNEEGGAGDIGTDELRKKYKKDTPNESLEEAKTKKYLVRAETGPFHQFDEMEIEAATEKAAEKIFKQSYKYASSFQTKLVKESLNETKKIGTHVEITKGPHKGKRGYVRLIRRGQYGNLKAVMLDLDLEDGGEAVVDTKETKIVK